MNKYGITHIRIDDRLIHGQVATMWINKLGISRVMVIDNNVANDPLQKQILRMATPANIASSIIDEQTAITNLLNFKYQHQKVLIIVKNPMVICRLLKANIPISSINIGNMSHRENTFSLRGNISVNDEELISFKKLLSCGVTITTIMTPDDRESYLNEIL